LTNIVNLVNIHAMSKQNRESILDMIYITHLYLQGRARTPHDYGAGDLLYSSEIHTVVAVSKAPGCNLTTLAAQLNISKAAVSKFVAKLVRMGYLVKSKPVNNDREVIFNLTKKGQTAVNGHQAFEMKTFGPFLKVEAALSEHDYQAIKDFFKKVTSLTEK